MNECWRKELEKILCYMEDNPNERIEKPTDLSQDRLKNEIRYNVHQNENKVLKRK